MIWNQIRHFTKEEFLGWGDQMEPALVVFLDRLRAAAGVPFRVLDTGRHKAGNPTSEHLPHPTTGRIQAVDFAPGDRSPEVCMRVWELAHEAGVPGLGAYPERFLHVDVAQGDRQRRPARWVRSPSGEYTNWALVDGWPEDLVARVGATFGVDPERLADARFRGPSAGIPASFIVGGVSIALFVYAARRLDRT